MNTYTFYSDPGHAWLKVSVQEIKHYNIAHLISNYSYVDNRLENVYLEEDLDAYLFLNNIKKFNIEYTFQEKHMEKDIYIRKLPRFKDVYINNKDHFGRYENRNLCKLNTTIAPLSEGFYHV